MDRATHIIDPDGEVVIVLQNPNAPFAELSEAQTSDNFTYLLPGPSEDIQNPAEGIEALRNEPTGSGRKRKKEKKKKKTGSTSGWRAVHDPSQPIHLPFEGPAPEWPAAEEPVAEPVAEPTEGPVEEPVAEHAEEPVDEEPAKLGVIEQPEEKCFRIQVSAKHLILASSVFRKILTGGWKESITYLQKGSVEITADSWDLDALLIMLRILHCQSYQIPRKMTLEMLAKVGVLADYYDCRETVVFFADTWINALDDTIPTTYSRDLILWLWVAWYFHLPAKFKQATSTAMSLGDGWIDNLGLPIPEDVIRSIDDRRQAEIAGLIFQLHETRDQLQNGSKGCGFECSSIMYGALTKQMHQNALLLPRPAAPFPGLSYRSLVQVVSSFKSPVWSNPRPYYSREKHECDYSSFRLLFGMLKDTIEGLDLDSYLQI
ncbi:hypothetical protein BDW60DRAFT_222340 [Aspergillus nidulans var. acristatus]